MKTVYFSCLALPFQTQYLLAAREKDAHLPLPVLNDKMAQYVLQNFAIGYHGEWTDAFYDSCQIKALGADAPPASVQIRVDYNPNYGLDTPENWDPAPIPDWANPQHVWPDTMLALNRPDSWEHFPHLGLIDQIRIKVIVGPDQTHERTIWQNLQEKVTYYGDELEGDLTFGGKLWKQNS